MDYHEINEHATNPSDEIKKQYSLFVIRTEYKERFLMELGVTRETARIVINLEFEAARYPLETLLNAEENLLRDSSGPLSSFKNSCGCGCFGGWVNPAAEIEKYKKLLKESIEQARIRSVTEVQYFIPKKTFWQKLSNLQNLKILKSLTPIERFLISKLDIFSLNKSDPPDLSKRLLNCMVTGCLFSIVLLVLLLVIAILFAPLTEYNSIDDSSSVETEKRVVNITPSVMPQETRESQFSPVDDTPYGCFLKLDDITNSIVTHPRTNSDPHYRQHVRERLLELRVRATDIIDNCSTWGTELCELNLVEYLQDCQITVAEQASLLDSLNQVDDYQVD